MASVCTKIVEIGVTSLMELPVDSSGGERF
jgi:hypothetical protein